MLDFVENYYEVTEENKELLRKFMMAEDIRNYAGKKLDLDYFVTGGRVLGNNKDHCTNRTGFWSSRNTMTDFERKKLTTHITKPLIEME